MKQIGGTELRKFSLGLAVIAGGLGAFQAWRGHPTAGMVLMVSGGVSLLLALLAPGAMKPVHFLFSKAGQALGWVNTRIILAFIYYLVFTPTSLVMKLLGRDSLGRRFDPSAASYWIKKPEETRGPERYEKMF